MRSSPLFGFKEHHERPGYLGFQHLENNQGEYLISRSSFVFINAWDLKETIKDIKNV